MGDDGDRPDKLDLGPEYRALVGLPGGLENGGEFVERLKQEAAKKNVQLVAGKGGDADTLGKRRVWVMDSNVFPFRQAEIYHQYHGKVNDY